MAWGTAGRSRRRSSTSARTCSSARTRRRSTLRGARRPGRRRVPERDGTPPGAGSRRVPRARAAADVPLLGICLGMHLAFERSSELGGAAGLGIVPGEVRGLAADGLKLPQIGWNEVRWERRVAPLLDGVRERPSTTTCTASWRCPPTRATSSGPPSTASASRRSSPTARSSASSSTPRSPRTTACACSRTGSPPARGARVILYPAIDILDGRAVRLVRGDFDQATEYAATRSRPRGAGLRRARGGSTSSTSTARAPERR